MPTSRDIANYHDFLVFVFLSAPDSFPEEDYLPPEEQMTLDMAFARLCGDLNVLSARVKDERKMVILRELLSMSLGAYTDGEIVRGAHILQAFEALVWPKYKHANTYVAEAELRVDERQGGGV